jgi:hypothetical protein
LTGALDDTSQQVLMTINPLSQQNDSKFGKMKFGTYKLPCHGSGGLLPAQVRHQARFVMNTVALGKGFFFSFFEYFSFTVSIIPTHHTHYQQYTMLATANGVK